MTLTPALVEDITTSTMGQPKWINTENPQLYDQSQWAYISSHPKRHILGVVGGNEASLVNGNVTDVESDLTRRTRPLTKCGEFLHHPVGEVDGKIVRKNRKYDLTLDISKHHIPAYQMWAYPTVMAPEPLKTDSCKFPHKY